MNALCDEEPPGIVQKEPMTAVGDVALGEIHPRLERQIVLSDAAKLARRHDGMVPGMRHMFLQERLAPFRRSIHALAVVGKRRFVCV